MKDLILIGAHCPDDEREKLLNKCIDSLYRFSIRISNTFDVCIKDKSDNKVINFIKLASSLGFKGIGVYDGLTIHIDIRDNPSYWGRNFTSSSAPDWAKETLIAHYNGKFLGKSSDDLAMNSEKSFDLDKLIDKFKANPNDIKSSLTPDDKPKNEIDKFVDMVAGLIKLAASK